MKANLKKSENDYYLKQASSFTQRLRGLTIYSEHPKGLIFIIANCKLVHTFGMKYCIDLVFIDQHLRITQLFKNVPPGNIKGSFNAKHSLELEAGTINNLKLSQGDVICTQTLPWVGLHTEIAG